MNAAIFAQMLQLFGLMLAGYLCNKGKVMDSVANAKFSRFLLNVALPCTILNSAFQNLGMEKQQLISAFLLAVTIFCLIPCLSSLLCKFLKLDKTFQLMLNYSNLGFMGMPIISSVYGEDAVFFVAIFMMVFNLHIFTFGVITLQGKPSGLGEMGRKLLSPGILAAVLAFAVVLLGIPAPAALSRLIASIGSVTTPLAMMVIGSQLAQVQLRDTFTSGKLYILAFVKLALYPALVYALLTLLLGPSLLTNITTVLCALPTAGNVSMLCSEYDGDIQLAAQGTCVSTLLSVLSIPILLLFL